MHSLRIRSANAQPIREQGDYVLYWMTSARRTRWNHGLDRARELAHSLNKPLVVLEALRCGYEYASDRVHAFVLQGMADNQRDFAQTGVTYYPYVEPAPNAGSGLLDALAEKACVVVGDLFPTGFLRRCVPLSLGRLAVKAEIVDSNGLLPLDATSRAYARAFDFRRFVQRNLADHLDDMPSRDPVQTACGGPEIIPAEVMVRWPAADEALLRAEADALAELPIDHSVSQATIPGGSLAGGLRLQEFAATSLGRYGDDRNHPDRDGASGLSPYLHFGHVGAHQVFAAVIEAEGWDPGQLGDKATGGREGWWGMSKSAEAFLDQLVTWRGLGFAFCHLVDDHKSWESIPGWARQTLMEHSRDPRSESYELNQLEQAETSDDVWNAAQRQLVSEGRMHNYLRMLWGKRILEWAGTPWLALEWMFYLNDKYALDGRDPNSVSGITWCVGRFDRAWGPERPIFGKIRYMSSANTARKLRLRKYLERYALSEGTA